MQVGDNRRPPPNYPPPAPPISAKKIDVYTQPESGISPSKSPTPPPRDHIDVAQTTNTLFKNQNPVAAKAPRPLPPLPQRVRVVGGGPNPKGTEAVKEETPAIAKKVAFPRLKAAGQAISAKFSSLKRRAVKLLPSRSKPPSSTPVPGNIQQALSNSSVGRTNGPQLDPKNAASHAALAQIEEQLLTHLQKRCLSHPGELNIIQSSGTKFGRDTSLSDVGTKLKTSISNKDYTNEGAAEAVLKELGTALSPSGGLDPTEVLALGKKLAADRPCLSNDMRNELMKDFKDYGQARADHKNLSTVPQKMEDDILEKSGISPLREKDGILLTYEANQYLREKKRELGEQFHGTGKYSKDYNNKIQPLIESKAFQKISRMRTVVQSLPEREIARIDTLVSTIRAIKESNKLTGATQQESVAYTGTMMMFRPFFFKDTDLYVGKSPEEKNAAGFAMDGAMEFLVNNWESIKPES